MNNVFINFNFTTSPRLGIAGVLREVLPGRHVVLVLDPHHAAGVEELVSPILRVARDGRTPPKRNVLEAVPLVPLLPSDVVGLEVLELALGHAPVGLVPHVDPRRDVLVVRPAVERLPPVESDR